MDNTDDAETLNKALILLVDIREAAGDPEGKLMQDELVARIQCMREALAEILEEVGPRELGENLYKKATSALQ